MFSLDILPTPNVYKYWKCSFVQVSSGRADLLLVSRFLQVLNPTFTPTKEGVVPHGNVRKLTTLFIRTFSDALSCPTCVDSDESMFLDLLLSMVSSGFGLPVHTMPNTTKNQPTTNGTPCMYQPPTNSTNTGLPEPISTRNRKTPAYHSRDTNSSWVTLIFSLSSQVCPKQENTCLLLGLSCHALT